MDSIKRIISDAESQYEKYTASGCSVHEFNRFKHNAIGRLKDYLNGKGENYLYVSMSNVNFLNAWMKKREDVVNTVQCTNHGIKKFGEGWKLFCNDCEFNEK